MEIQLSLTVITFHERYTVSDVRIAVQGFGNVGSEAALLFEAEGANVISVQDHSATLFHEKGINVTELMKWQSERGSIKGYPQASEIDMEKFWDIDAEIFIPAALESQIDTARARRLKCRIVLEGANGPTYSEADDVLAERGVIVVPDVICNAGGVTVSYFEWVQDMASFFWTEEEINQRLDKIMREAISQVWSKSEQKNCSLRTAAYIVACERILLARKERGIYPG